MLGVFADNIKKIAASKASFHVSFNLYEGYLDCLDDIKNYCKENFGALPHIAIMRDHTDGTKLYDPVDLATYKSWGADFHSSRFDIECENFLVNRAKYFCHAGETSWVLKLATGDLARCYCEPPYFNIYNNVEEKIPQFPVGRHCRDTYCINASWFLACGNVPEVNYPNYTQLRDRPEAGWHKKTIKDAIGQKMIVKDNKPSVLLLGDSISLGYREFVKENLRGVMNVYYPAENGRMAAYTFRSLYEWWKDYDWPADMNFIYWNNGLWDVAHIFGDDEPQTPLAEYEKLIGRTYHRLKHLFPKAQIIFATTTPVIEERYDKEISYSRNEEIERYNEAAKRVVLSMGGSVHDLYLARDFYPPQAYLDSVHLIPQVSQILAKNISKLLLERVKKI